MPSEEHTPNLLYVVLSHITRCTNNKRLFHLISHERGHVLVSWETERLFQHALDVVDDLQSCSNAVLDMDFSDMGGGVVYVNSR